MPTPTSREYERITPDAQRYASVSLDLELGIIGDRLRFFAGGEELSDPDALIDRLESELARAERRLAGAEKAIELLKSSA